LSSFRFFTGIKWIKQRYGERMKVIRLGQKGYLDKIEQAIAAGEILLIENIDESIEAVLDPLLGRNTIRKGRAIKLGDKEIEYHPDFRLILQTKLANPHYKPEMQAQTTLINFTVTKDGLEDQLLADVVAKVCNPCLFDDLRDMYSHSCCLLGTSRSRTIEIRSDQTTK
jgi:dynein heavy chain